MKNGDPRSAAWVRRNLPAYLRDNRTRTREDLQSLLMLVIHDLVPSLDEIGAWTPKERLLADDWAMNAHWSASDNNNRVPAMPEHLVAYRRRYPQRPAFQCAADVVRAMGDDNGACFHPTPKQTSDLVDGIAGMMKAGCFFTDAEVELFGAGEHGEMLEHFQRFDGFDRAQAALVAIFEELDDGGKPKSDEQRVRDSQQHHSNHKRST